MLARSWNAELERDCTQLRVRSIWRDLIGWGGAFGSILVLMGLWLLLGPDAFSEARFLSLAVVMTAPFAGLCLVGVWGDSWLSRIRRRGHGVAAEPPWRRRLFLALLVTWVRTAVVIAGAWAVGGLALVVILAL